MSKLIKKCLSAAMACIMTFQMAVPTFAAISNKEPEIVSIKNRFIEIKVNKANGGYVINTLEGDVVKDSDDNKSLLQGGINYDTSFTTFQINGDKGKEYIFGNQYGFLNLATKEVQTSVDSTGITSAWSVDKIEVTQRIELVNDLSSDQLGTAKINYTVKNNSSSDITAKARLLMDTMLGSNDSAAYEIPKPGYGNGYEVITSESDISGTAVPTNYFAKDNGFNPTVMAFGVNEILNETQKPYKMTFAHWANISATKFDYIIDPNLTFTSSINTHKTADSAIASYFDLDTIPAGGERSLTTYYGVTANVGKEQDKVIVNPTAPKKLELTADGKGYIGDNGKDNYFQVETTVSNTKPEAQNYENAVAVAYVGGGLVSLGPPTQGSNFQAEYNNDSPYAIPLKSFKAGESRPLKWDFRAIPKANHALGQVLIKIYNMPESAKGVYLEENVIGKSENLILLPSINADLPLITVTSAAPKMLYNDDKRIMTISGIGMSFFNLSNLKGIEARKVDDSSTSYMLNRNNLSIASDGNSMNLIFDKYMKPGRYQIHFLWDNPPSGIDADMTAPDLWVDMTSDDAYRNNKYGVVTVQRTNNDPKSSSYTVVNYSTESEYKSASENLQAGVLILTFRGEFVEDKADSNIYKLAGKNQSVSINGVVDFTGSSMSIDKSDGALIKMDGKIITTGSKTTVREGPSKIELKNGTKYVIPQYDEEDGEVVSKPLDFGEKFIDIRWDSGIDFFQTIGGFAMNLRYGVFGEMVSQVGTTGNYKKEGNVISFGGSLDLSFMTPGGAQTARENKSKNPSWETMNVPKNAFDTTDRQEMEVAPTTQGITMPAAAVYINDVLFGQHKEQGTDTPDTGYIGINASAQATLPKIVECFPSSMSGNIEINTIGNYRVAVDGSVEATNFALSFSLVVKEDPSGNGAPIPDKLYFMIGGFEPGFNVDSMGIFWITGGGGGFDKLYDTIFGTDGVPPFTLLLTVQFDIFKIMTGTADLELSLRSLGVTLSDVSLKMIRNAKFLDGGSIKIAWYPNFAVNIGAKVDFSEIFSGSFSLSASVDDKFFEMFLGVGIQLPNVIPIVGGLQVAYAEIGGGTEKLWGLIELLGIQLGVTYYWSSGDVIFGKRSSMMALASDTLYASTAKMISRPYAIDYDTGTGQTKFMEMGSNLEIVAGSGENDTLTEEQIQKFKEGPSESMLLRGLSAPLAQTPYVNSTKDSTSHLFNLGAVPGSNVLYINSKNNEMPDNIKEIIKIYAPDNSLYNIKYYDKTKSEEENKAANANMIVSDGTDGNAKAASVYITIPVGSYISGDWLADLGDFAADFTIVGVKPIANLTDLDASCTGNNLSINWDGAALDGATLNMYVTQDMADSGVSIANGIQATDKNAQITLPDTLSSGSYYVRVVLSKEGECFTQYFAKYSNKTSDYKKVAYINNKAPEKPISVDLKNYGNDKLKVDIKDPVSLTNLDGYLVDVYEENESGDFMLKQVGLYYSKEQAQNILIGGVYIQPIFENGKPKLNPDGTSVTTTAGFIPDKQYKVVVRAAKKASDAAKNGQEILYCSDTVSSEAVKLIKTTPAQISIDSKQAGAKKINNVLWMNKKETNFTITTDKPVTGTWSMDGAYGGKFDTAATTFEITKNISDGQHTLEFSGREAGDNDAFIYSTIIGVDTTPPQLLLDNPIHGSTFTDNQIDIKGIVDTKAKYSFVLDGNTILQDVSLQDSVDAQGILNYRLNLGEGPITRKLQIIASDELGNTTECTANITSADLSKIKKVFIAQNGQRVNDGVLAAKNVGDTAQLQLMGVIPQEGSNPEQIIDITESSITAWNTVGGKSSVHVDDKGFVTVRTFGDAFVEATFRVSSQVSLSDSVVVPAKVENQKPDDPDPVEPDPGNNSQTPGGGSVVSEKDKLQELLDSYARHWTSGQITLSYKEMQEQLSTNGSVTLRTAEGTMEIPKDAVNSLNLGADESLSLTVKRALSPINSSSLCLYSMELKAGSREIIDFGGKNIILRLPYSNTENNDPDVLIGFYLTDKNEHVIMKNSKYDPSAGQIAILTNHLGVYGLKSNLQKYEDITGHWSTGNINFVTARQLFSGTGYQLFDPDGQMTRGMFATVLARLDNADTSSIKASRFKDVEAGVWYTPYIEWAAEKGILSGTGNGMFEPNKPVTRQEMAVMIANYVKFKGYTLPEKNDAMVFADERNVASWAKEAINTSQKAGLINGKPGNVFCPEENATRAEVSAIFKRFIEAMLN